MISGFMKNSEILERAVKNKSKQMKSINDKEWMFKRWIISNENPKWYEYNKGI